MNLNHNPRALPRSPNTHHDKLHTNGETEEIMWSSMLDGVASGKRLPEKNILVLGRSGYLLREMARAGTERMIQGAIQRARRTFSRQLDLIRGRKDLKSGIKRSRL